MEQHQGDKTDTTTSRINKRMHSIRAALHRLGARHSECVDWVDSIAEQVRLGQTDDKAWLEADESVDALCDDARDLLRLAAAAHEAALTLQGAVRDAEAAAAERAEKAAGGAL